jgi:hypothetical protein
MPIRTLATVCQERFRTTPHHDARPADEEGHRRVNVQGGDEGKDRQSDIRPDDDQAGGIRRQQVRHDQADADKGDGGGALHQGPRGQA